MRVAAIWLGLSLAWACSVVDSLDGYEGPPISQPKDAGSDGVAASGGAGGSGASAGTSGSGGFPTVDCQLDSDCDDKNPCNGKETCAAGGVCKAGAPPSLDDGNTCTVDYCDPVKGVVHQGGAGVPVKICASTSTPCPKGYFPRRTLICDPECGTNCPFCVNGFSCEEACLEKIQTCCRNDDCKTVCPSGYSYVSQLMTTDCGCAAVKGPAAVCQRN